MVMSIYKKGCFLNQCCFLKAIDLRFRMLASAGRAVSPCEDMKCCSCVYKKILMMRASSSHALREEYSGSWHADLQESRTLHSNQFADEVNHKNAPEATIL
jgi:hypothetical protein